MDTFPPTTSAIRRRSPATLRGIPLSNRTKRIFNDRTGAGVGANTKPFLLQTYKRDTGEVMHDLSLPIQVDGRHWGGFRIGYKSRSLGNSKD